MPLSIFLIQIVRIKMNIKINIIINVLFGMCTLLQNFIASQITSNGNIILPHLMYF